VEEVARPLNTVKPSHEMVKELIIEKVANWQRMFAYSSGEGAKVLRTEEHRGVRERTLMYLCSRVLDKIIML
jgi:hypothetical protein